MLSFFSRFAAVVGFLHTLCGAIAALLAAW